MQVAPHESISNLSQWIKAVFGYSPDWLHPKNTDKIVKISSRFLFYGGIIWLLLSFCYNNIVMSMNRVQLQSLTIYGTIGAVLCMVVVLYGALAQQFWPPLNIEQPPSAMPSLTTEETQFRLDLRKFILSNVTEINTTFSRMDGGLLNTLAANPHGVASDNLKFSRDMLQRYIEMTMYQRYVQLYEAANNPIEDFDVKELGKNLKLYFDGYRQSQAYFKAFLNIAGVHPNKDNLLRIWLEADSRALYALHDLKASPQAAKVAGIDDGYFPTRTGTFASYFPKDN